MDTTKMLIATLKLCEVLKTIKQNSRVGDLKWQPNHVNSTMQHISLLELIDDLKPEQQKIFKDINNKARLIAALNKTLEENLIILANSDLKLKQCIETFEITRNLIQLQQTLTNIALSGPPYNKQEITNAFSNMQESLKKTTTNKHISNNKRNILNFTK